MRCQNKKLIFFIQTTQSGEWNKIILTSKKCLESFGLQLTKSNKIIKNNPTLTSTAASGDDFEEHINQDWSSSCEGWMWNIKYGILILRKLNCEMENKMNEEFIRIKNNKKHNIFSFVNWKRVQIQFRVLCRQMLLSL